MGDTPLTVAEAASHFHVTPRKLRELVREHRPRVLRAGRELLFDAQAIHDLTEAMRCHSTYASAATPGTRVGRSKSQGSHQSGFRSSAQAKVHELVQKQLQESKKRRSAAKLRLVSVQDA